MNRIGRAALLGLSLVALSLAGCATKKRSAPPRPPATVPAMPPSASISAARYVEMAASNALLSLRSSELAATRSRSTRLRAFAEAGVRDQSGISAQLSFAGRRLNLLPSPTLSPRHQAMFDQLGASAEFDVTYRRQQVIVLGEAYELHDDYARRGASPTLRPVAAMAAPILRRHLAQLRGL